MSADQVNSLFDPARLGERDEDGWVFHPDLDQFDTASAQGEEGGYDMAAIRAAGFEIEIVDLFDDTAQKAALAEYDEGHQLASWTPTTPQGDGWRLVCVCDDEDSPKAMFVRRCAAPARIDGAP